MAKAVGQRRRSGNLNAECNHLSYFIRLAPIYSVLGFRLPSFILPVLPYAATSIVPCQIGVRQSCTASKDNFIKHLTARFQQDFISRATISLYDSIRLAATMDHIRPLLPRSSYNSARQAEIDHAAIIPKVALQVSASFTSC